MVGTVDINVSSVRVDAWPGINPRFKTSQPHYPRRNEVRCILVSAKLLVAFLSHPSLKNHSQGCALPDFFIDDMKASRGAERVLYTAWRVAPRRYDVFSDKLPLTKVSEFLLANGNMQCITRRFD